MCIGCYEEYESPVERCGTTEQVVVLIREIYEESCVGGGMHIQLDDWNLDDEHFDSECEGFLKTENERACFALMKAMTVEQRATALAICNGFVTETK